MPCHDADDYDDVDPLFFSLALNTFLFLFCFFSNVSPFPATLLLLLLIRPSTTSVDFNYTATITTTARNSKQWKFCFWRGAFGCASWCGRRRPSSTKVDLFRWQSTTNSFSRAFSMCRCKYAYVCVCVCVSLCMCDTINVYIKDIEDVITCSQLCGTT